MDLSLRRTIIVAATSVPAAVISSSVRLAVHLSTKWCSSPLLPLSLPKRCPLAIVVEFSHPMALLTLCHSSVTGHVLLQESCAPGQGDLLQQRQTWKELTAQCCPLTRAPADGACFVWGRDLSSGSPLLPPAVKRLLVDVVILQELFVETGFTRTQWMELLLLHTVYRSLQRSAFLFCLRA